MTVEPHPFTQLSWKGLKNKRRWQPIREKLNYAGFFAEYEMVRRGHRQCDIYQLDADQFDWQLKKVMDDSLVIQPILRSRKYSGFGHRHYCTDVIDSDTFIFSVVARSLEDAQTFREANLGDIDHRLIGEMLGYPDCCIDWFLEAWLKDGCIDPLFEAAANTEGSERDGNTVTVTGHPWFNRFIRYFGFHVIPYFTHNLKCPESEKFAEIFHSLMMEHSPDAVEALDEALTMPVTWTLNNLIIEVDHPLFRGAVNGYYWPEKLTVKWSPE